MSGNGHAHLRADSFCENCGYNVRGQPVHRDAVLGLMVCRCAECGRNQLAGQALPPMSVWARRGGELVMAVWWLIVLAVIGFGGFVVGAMQLLHVHAYSFPKLLAADGREVTYLGMGTGDMRQVYADTLQPASVRRNVLSLKRPSWHDPRSGPPWWAPAVLLLYVAIITLPVGILLANLLWYWRRRQLAVMLLVPILAAIFLTGVIWVSDEYYLEIRHWAIPRVFLWAFIEAGLMYVGLRIGRPVGRLTLRMFVPPTPRQHLAFLWKVDGKTPPAAPIPQ